MTAPAGKFPNTVIRASAGTGKTYQLANRFIGLAAAGERPDHILAATFARKAAGEILDRVLFRLAEGVSESVKLRKLAEAIGEPSLDRPRALDILRDAVRRLHRLRIGTLDSFFVQMAGHFSLELGMHPGWQIVEELYDRRLRSKAIQEVLRRESTTDLVTLMQLLSKGEVVRTVTSQIRGVVDPLYDLYRQTPRDAWHSLQRRKPLAPNEVAGAIADIAAVTLPTHKKIADNRLADMHLATIGDWPGFISRGLPSKIIAGEATYYTKPIEPHVVIAYQPLIDHAQAVLVNRVVDQTEATWRLLQKFEVAYERLKRERGAYRFDDLTRKLASEFTRDQVQRLAYRLDAHITHMLLDEFQDTSLAQWSVMRPLAEQVTRPGSGQSFFCVGDVKQAIYGWRGGLSEIFDAVDGQLPGLTHRSLTRSFRSSQVVIDTVNAVFENLSGNAALADFSEVTKVWRERYEKHTTERTDLEGYSRLVVAPRAGDEDDQEEVTLRFAAAEVARLAGENPGRSIGVLVRTNDTVAALIGLLQREHQLQASEEGGNPLTNSVAVELILSLLKLADHPGDTAARFHVATSPLGGSLQYADHANTEAALSLAARIREELLASGYGRTIYGWVEMLAPACDARELNRLLQLVELAYAYDSQASVRPADFVAHVEATKVEDPTASEVRVMTVHQAKGLQFDIVVLPELDVNLKGQPPLVVVGREKQGAAVTRVCRYANEDIQALLPVDVRKMFGHVPYQMVNESLCLLYVAMTRAVHALHMIVRPSKANEKIWPKTFAGVLRSAFAPGQAQLDAGKMVHEDGAKNCCCSGKAHATDGNVPAVEPIALQLRSSGERRRRGLDRRSPSSLEGGTQVDLSKRLRLETARATSRGSLFHAWLECIEWLDGGMPEQAVFDAKAREFAVAGLDIVAEFARFRAVIAKPAVCEALCRTTYRHYGTVRFEVWRERSFAVREENTLLQGAVDRIVLMFDGDRLVATDILDFKTDRVFTDGDVRERGEHYRPQLEAYRRAVAALVRLDPTHVTARAVFLEPGVVVNL